MSAATLLIGDILSQLMFDKKIRPTELARQINVPQPTIQRIVSGATTQPHSSTLQQIADYFSISVEQLKGLKPIPWLTTLNLHSNKLLQVPLLDWQQAATWKKDKTHNEEMQLIYTDAQISPNTFALPIKDSSMEPLFPKGTIIIVDKEKPFKDRSYVVVALKNYPEVLFRQLLIDGPHQYVKPISPNLEHFKMHLLSKQDKILGMMVQARRDYGAFE